MSKWARKENENYIISEKTAEDAVRELLDFYECGTTGDNNAMDDLLDDLVKAYRRGEVENKMDETLGFCVMQHVRTVNGKETLTYRELTGKDRIYAEGFDSSKYVARIYSILGRLSGFGEEVIMKLKGQDWRNASVIAMVFTMASQG